MDRLKVTVRWVVVIEWWDITKKRSKAGLIQVNMKRDELCLTWANNPSLILVACRVELSYWKVTGGRTWTGLE